jgi:SAM-dependent methyltransferase
METLRQISSRYQTDKSQLVAYLDNYERWFGDLRQRPITLLELGVLDGGSLQMWRDYFPNGSIVGLDLTPPVIDDATGRIRVYAGQQQDTDLLDRIAKENAPNGFDIVIDDCSHIASLARMSFRHLFDSHLKNGGFYVIEDWGAGYWDGWPDGSRYRTRNFSNTIRVPERIGYKLASILRHNLNAWYSPFLSLVKRRLVSRNSSSHNAGMVGFVKELLDEVALSDIYHPENGMNGSRTSMIKELAVMSSHTLVIKK